MEQSYINELISSVLNDAQLQITQHRHQDRFYREYITIFTPLFPLFLHLSAAVRWLGRSDSVVQRTEINTPWRLHRNVNGFMLIDVHWIRHEQKYDSVAAHVKILRISWRDEKLYFGIDKHWFVLQNYNFSIYVRTYKPATCYWLPVQSFWRERDRKLH